MESAKSARQRFRAGKKEQAHPGSCDRPADAVRPCTALKKKKTIQVLGCLNELQTPA
jgi:hypothetical protein